MGVYTRLYAPIFNYIHMSQAEKTNTSDTSKKPRLYSRGNDQINLDDYIRNLESGFDAWLNSRKIKDKYKDAVREAYREMVTRLNSGDGSFTSRLGGGFQDSTGKIKNADKGFDATGVAASYLGHTLRGMNIYKEPESTPDPSKIKYEDGALGTALTRRLLGSAGTIQDFIDRDPYNKDTRTRGNSVRSKDFRELLSTTAADLRAGAGEFSDWTEDQRTKGASDLEGLFTIFDNDGQITDDEYLQLARVTGMSDLRKMFTTGESADLTTTDRPEQRSRRTHTDKIRAIQNRWKPYTGQLTSPIVIGKTDMSKLGPDTANKISDAFNNASTQDLTEIIQDILNGKTLETRFISKVFNGQNPFAGSTEENVRNFLLTNALNLLKSKPADHNGGLHNFGESNFGSYYIGGTQTDKNTGFVYDDNNHTISEMSIHNIPYWQKYINNWWDSQVDSDDYSDLDPTLLSIYKDGGILYAKAGTIMDRNKGRGPGVPDGNPYLAVENTLENAQKLDLWDKYYRNSLIDANIRNSLKGEDESIDKFWKYGYQVDDKGNPLKDQNGQDLHGITAEQLGIYFNQLNELGEGLFKNKQLNATGYQDWNKKFDQTGLNYFFGGDSDEFDYLGPSTYNRYKLLQRLQDTYNKDNILQIDGNGIYWDGRKWQLAGPEIQLTASAITAKTPTPSPATVNLPDVDTDVDEVETGDKSKTGENRFLSTATNWAPDLLSSLRLYKSLRANNKIEDILRRSLKSEFRETPEKYSPVTGAFSEMQYANKQAADIRRIAGHVVTSDASLALATMLDANRRAYDIETRGFLSDDKEIRRTQAEALARQEDNLVKRVENANFHRASINKTNRELAQLEASRVGKDWKGIDNFIAGLQGRIDSKREALYDIARDNARIEMESTIEPYQIEFRNWLSDPKNSDITKHPKYLDYLDAIKNSRNAYTRKVNQAALYYAKQGGTIKPKQQDFIAQIIKLNNERNS